MQTCFGIQQVYPTRTGVNSVAFSSESSFSNVLAWQSLKGSFRFAQMKYKRNTKEIQMAFWLIARTFELCTTQCVAKRENWTQMITACQLWKKAFHLSRLFRWQKNACLSWTSIRKSQNCKMLWLWSILSYRKFFFEISKIDRSTSWAILRERFERESKNKHFERSWKSKQSRARLWAFIWEQYGSGGFDRLVLTNW